MGAHRAVCFEQSAKAIVSRVTDACTAKLFLENRLSQRNQIALYAGAKFVARASMIPCVSQRCEVLSILL
jgi:hypothetical protein